MFYSQSQSLAGFTTVAEIEYQARIGCGESPESRCGKASAAQEALDFADQHQPWYSPVDATPVVRLANRSNPKLAM